MKTISNVLSYFLDIFLPKEEKTLELENLSSEKLLELERSDDIRDEKLKSLFNYKNKTVRQIIWEIKYNKNQKILENLSKIFYEFILEEISDEILFGNFKNPIIVPIPSLGSLKEKGYNQAELLANEIFRNDGGKNFRIETNVLFKIKETDKQSRIKNRSERLKNLVGAFSANSNKIANQNIILIDDVITTGATMNEAVRALKEAGVKKVLGFSIAH